MGTFYVVSTPIGNLDDLTGRAASTLGSVDRILAEDTRRARILLQHLDVSTRPQSLHAHNEAKRCGQLVSWLDAGEDVALISDAGTPLVSDPGERAVRAVVDAGHRVVPIPGPSAILAGLVASGLPCGAFTFHGFLPRSSTKRDAVLERIRASSETAVVFEAPGRLTGLLGALEERLEEGRTVAVCRELTKVHEEVRRGTPGEVARYYEDTPPRGEVTVVIEGRSASTTSVEEMDLMAMAAEALADGHPPTEAARRVARRAGVKRREAYDAVTRAQGKARPDGEGT